MLFHASCHLNQSIWPTSMSFRRLLFSSRANFANVRFRLLFLSLAKGLERLSKHTKAHPHSSGIKFWHVNCISATRQMWIAVLAYRPIQSRGACCSIGTSPKRSGQASNTSKPEMVELPATSVTAKASTGSGSGHLKETSPRNRLAIPRCVL